MRLVIMLAIVGFASPAVADNKTDAEALFKKAKKLHADKKYSEACPMFEKSDALDSGIGAKLNVAKCYEDWGMLARAYRWYTDAEKMARDASDDRADKIKKLITGIEDDVPRLTIKIPDGVDASTAEITLDGKPLRADALGKEQRVDPGPHEVTWITNGAKKSKMLPMERGGEREVTLDMRATGGTPVVTPEKTPDPKPTDESPPSPGRTRRILGISVGAAGVVGFGVATVLALSARSSYNDALEQHCMGMKNACDDEGLGATSDARSKANVATVITVISLVAIGGGVVLYLTAPTAPPAKSKESQDRSTALYLTPLVTDDGGGVILGGGF